MSYKIQQILLILTWDIANSVFHRTGKKSCSASDLWQIYSISKQDIYDYIEENGLPANVFMTTPLQKDGMYLLEAPNKFKVYYQERVCKFDSKTFKEKKEAVRYLLDETIYHSGIQLKGT
jgi:NADPH-dependent 7-cyano-7-deazaguanine reductase QueF-like protein